MPPEGPSGIYPIEEYASPNFSPTPAHTCNGVCFHHTVLSFRETIVKMLRAESQVSYHVVIDADGRRATLVPDHRIAWHAGASLFHGRTRCNDFLLGCAFAGDTYRTPLTEAQLASATEWLRPRWSGYQWSFDWLTDHRQIAPERKNDLNPAEWDRLVAYLQRHLQETRPQPRT